MFLLHIFTSLVFFAYIALVKISVSKVRLWIMGTWLQASVFIAMHGFDRSKTMLGEGN